MIIEIKGKKVGIKFNNYACEQFLSLKGIEKTLYGFVYALVYGGYEGWKFVKENQPGFVDPEILFEDIVDWVDSSANNESIAEQIKSIRAEYEQSQIYIKSMKIEAEKKTEAQVPEQSPTSTSSPLESSASGPAIITG